MKRVFLNKGSKLNPGKKKRKKFEYEYEYEIGVKEQCEIENRAVSQKVTPQMVEGWEKSIRKGDNVRHAT